LRERRNIRTGKIRDERRGRVLQEKKRRVNLKGAQGWVEVRIAIGGGGSSREDKRRRNGSMIGLLREINNGS